MRLVGSFLEMITQPNGPWAQMYDNVPFLLEINGGTGHIHLPDGMDPSIMKAYLRSANMSGGVTASFSKNGASLAVEAGKFTLAFIRDGLQWIGWIVDCKGVDICAEGIVAEETG